MRIVKDNYGPKPSLMKWAYEGVVLPSLTYGCIVWGKKLGSFEPQLRRLNRMAINTMVSIPRSTPTRAVELITGLVPLNLAIEEKAMLSYTRLKNKDPLSESLRATDSHLLYWKEKCENIGDTSNTESRIEDCHPKKYDVNLSSFSGEKKYSRRSQYTVYTDGSKLNGKLGAGYQIYKGTEPFAHGSVKLPDWATVFQAEVLAIKTASQRLQQDGSDVKWVKILSDSQAALLALNGHEKQTSSVNETKLALNDLARTANYVTLCWTRSHVGNEGNERADQLAKEGTSSDEYIDVPRPLCDLKSKIKECTIQRWNSSWNRYGEARMSKQFIGSYNQKRAKDAISFGRRKLGTLIRIITGHNALNYFASKVDENRCSLCRFCLEEDETFWHFATDCPVFWKERRDTFLNMNPDTDNWEVKLLLQLSDQVKIAKALEGYDDIYYEDNYDYPNTQNNPDPEPD
jgi:ribonuclease HI